MLIHNSELWNRVTNLGEPFSITITDAAVPVAAGQTFTIPMAAGYMYQIKGMEVTVTGNQLFEGAWITSALNEVPATPPFVPAKTIRGASVHLSRNKYFRRRQFSLTFHRGTVSGGAVVNLMDDLEFPVGVTLRRAYCNCENLGATLLNIDLTVGAGAAVTIASNAGAAVAIFENENLNINIPPDTNCLLEMDDAAGGAVTDMTVILWFEINDEQVDYEQQEYVPIVLHRSANAGALDNLMDDFEVPENMVVRRAYANLGTAMGGGNTLDFFINGINLFTITDPAVVGENENLNIPLPADVDNLIELTESGGASADVTLILWCQRTTPITQSENPPDIEEVYGPCFVNQNDSITIQYDQGVTLEQISATIYGTRYRLRN